MTQMKSAIGGIPVNQAMLTDFKSIRKDNTLEEAIALTLAGSQKDFPVMQSGSLEGILTQGDLLSALSEHGQHSPVSSAMQQDFISVDAFDMLETALRKLKECNCHTLPVIRNSRLVGLLTMDNLGEYMRIKEALKSPN